MRNLSEFLQKDNSKSPSLKGGEKEILLKEEFEETGLFLNKDLAVVSYQNY